MELYDLSIARCRKLLEEREVTSREVTASVLGRIERVEGSVRSFITVNAEEALNDAALKDKEEQSPEKPLLGVPLAVKDIICTKGLRTTCGSRILEGFVPPFDATCVARLRSAGAVIIGKTNLDEFAMGSSTENSGFFPTKNPWDLNRVPGGSSGGSAAAVAAGECIGSLGTDTGGSIRQPASHCGVVGLKPTYGRVSRYGLVAFASSLDQAGPITKDVLDAAILMNVISGHDPKDSTCAPVEVPDFTESLIPGLGGLKVGLPREYFGEGVDPEVAGLVRRAVEMLKDAGAEVKEVSLPHTDYAVAAYYIIAPAEASSNLARYDGVRYGLRVDEDRGLREMYEATRAKGFGAEVKRRIVLGTYALSSGYYDAYYRKASQVRTLVLNDFKEAFKEVDIIAAPVAPTPAFKLGELVDDPLTMYLSDVFTLPGSLAGIPGISIPAGFTSRGLPVGVQILGPHFGEEVILKAAYNVELARGDLGKAPEL